MYALLLLPLYSYAGSSPFVYPDDPLNEFLASDVAAIYMNQLAIVLNAHALPDLVNTHLDHTRLLENRDRNPTEQKNIHSVWNTEMFYMAQLFPDPLGTRSTFTTEAVLAGWDVRSRDLTMFGLTGGFLHSYYNRSNRDNQGSINSGFLASYSNVMLGHAYTELAAWGIYQITTNKQHIREFVVETAVADIRSWGAELHTEFGYNFDRTWGYYTPYATFDYLLTWKGVMDSTSTGPPESLYPAHVLLYPSQRNWNKSPCDLDI